MQRFLTNFRWNLGTRVEKVLFSSTQSLFFFLGGGGVSYTLLILKLWHAFKPPGNLLLSNHWEVDRSQEPDYLTSTSNGGGSQFTWGNTKSHTEFFVRIHQGLNHIVTKSTWQFGLEVYRLDSRHQPNSSLIERTSHGNEDLRVNVSQRRLPPSLCLALECSLSCFFLCSFASSIQLDSFTHSTIIYQVFWKCLMGDEILKKKKKIIDQESLESSPYRLTC